MLFRSKEPVNILPDKEEDIPKYALVLLLQEEGSADTEDDDWKPITFPSSPL